VAGCRNLPFWNSIIHQELMNEESTHPCRDSYPGERYGVCSGSFQHILSRRQRPNGRFLHHNQESQEGACQEASREEGKEH
jgi:hypothetical protein